jgi:hypothetical protein
VTTPADPATCAPPPEHADKPWHWLQLLDKDPRPNQWDQQSARWWRYESWWTPEETAACGWRYVALCDLPQEGP